MCRENKETTWYKYSRAYNYWNIAGAKDKLQEQTVIDALIKNDIVFLSQIKNDRDLHLSGFKHFYSPHSLYKPWWCVCVVVLVSNALVDSLHRVT